MDVSEGFEVEPHPKLGVKGNPNHPSPIIYNKKTIDVFFFLGGNLEENPISLQLILGNLQKHEAIPGLWADPSIKLLPYGVD